MARNYQEHSIVITHAGWEYSIDVSYFSRAIPSVGYSPPKDAEVEFNVTNVENKSGFASYEEDLLSYADLEEHVINDLEN